MMRNFTLRSCFLIILLFLCSTHSSNAKLKACKPNGKVKGRKPPPGLCNQEYYTDCCMEGKFYSTYHCSPPVSKQTKAVLTLNSFEDDGDNTYGPSSCDGKFHTDEMLVVALSSGWYNHGLRCLDNITITAPNGRSINAIVVDECDSTVGCDADHDYQRPCANNVVDASKAVWKALGVPEDKWNKLDITWSV